MKSEEAHRKSNCPKLIYQFEFYYEFSLDNVQK